MDPLISTSISILALTASLISLYISWRSFNRDKPDLRVSLDYYPEAEYGTSFAVRVINFGRRIAFVELIYIHFRTGDPRWDSIAGGQPVREAEPFDIVLTIYGMDGPLFDPRKVTFVEVFDTLGNRYRFPRFSLKDWIEFRHLKNKIHQHWHKEIS